MLYVSERVILTCEDNNWEYIIGYNNKEGCAPTIEEEYQSIPEKERKGNAEYINGVIFKDREVNVLKYRETEVKRVKQSQRSLSG